MDDENHIAGRFSAARREPLLDKAANPPQDQAMELRVQKLETEVAAMRADISATRADASYIRGRLETLPTTWQMVTAVIAGNLALAGTLLGSAKLFAVK